MILGVSGQSRLSFVVVIDLAGGLRRNNGVERKIRPDRHKSSWEDFMSIQSVLVWAM